MAENKIKIPITRVNKFFDEGEFNLENDLKREYLEGDINMSLILYRVDKEKSAVDDIYGESYTQEIRFLPPIELSGLIKIDQPTNKNYGPKGTVRYLETGNLTFTVHVNLLKELDADISYGDYIAYPISETSVKYFVVSNDGSNNFDNSHTNKGFKADIRTVLCTPVNESEFKGI
jgi:hypothetical protein